MEIVIVFLAALAPLCLAVGFVAGVRVGIHGIDVLAPRKKLPQPKKGL